MIMTITLARGAVRLSHQRVIVKSLPAITSGRDGRAVYGQDRHADRGAHRTDPACRYYRRRQRAGAYLAWLNSHFESGLKSPLDNAILAHGTIDPSPWRKVDEVPFDFERRCVSVLVERDGARTLILKGAPEDVMRICISVEMPDGTGQVLTDELRTKLQAQFDRLSAQSFRLLGIASRTEPPDQAKPRSRREGLTFAGFAVFSTHRRHPPARRLPNSLRPAWR